MAAFNAGELDIFRNVWSASSTVENQQAEVPVTARGSTAMQCTDLLAGDPTEAGANAIDA